MNRNDSTLQEQAAPEKNTDNAYVQVGADGQPHMPTGENDPMPDNGEQLVEQTEPAK